MRHYVLIRSAYGPEWPTAANLRRLRLTEGITVRLLAAQTNRDWSLIVLVNPADPLLKRREAVFQQANVPVKFIYWDTAGVEMSQAPWDTAPETTPVQRVAATAYRAPWSDALGPRDDTILQTRLDDDDGLSPDALARVRAAAERMPNARMAWIMPEGFRIWDGHYVRVRHETNAMATLQTPPGDTLTVYDYGHRHVGEVASVGLIGRRAGWLWVRHVDTISGIHEAEKPISPTLRQLFPIEWSLLEGLRVPILLWHRLDGSSFDRATVASFAEQIRALSEAGWRTLTMADLADAVDKGSVKPRRLVLTFDDGYDDAPMAAAMLEEAGLRATFYLITNRVGEPGYMTWDDARALMAAGHEIGSHTANHLDLTSQPLEVKRAEIDDAQAAFKRELGREPVTFAYPYGLLDAQTVEVVADTFRMARGTEVASFFQTDANRYLQRRISPGVMSGAELLAQLEPYK